MKVEKVQLPHNSLLAKTKFDYADSYKSQNLPDEENNIDSLTVGKAFFMSSPNWIGKVFELRNYLFSLVGLKGKHIGMVIIVLGVIFLGNTAKQMTGTDILYLGDGIA